MTVADDVTLDDLILAKEDLSGADIKVVFFFTAVIDDAPQEVKLHRPKL